MRKVFTLLAAALLAEAAFGVALRNGVPVNGDSYTCTVKGVTFEMVFVEGGKDIYGVDVSDFWIGKFEVTQQQWLAVYGSWPGNAPSDTYGLGDNFPVYNVNWYDAHAFIDSLNVAVGGGKFRLPAEREWEYAARGGSAQEIYTHAGSNNPDLVAWHFTHPNRGSTWKTHPVGELAANGIGTYDMSGNATEWCEDWSNQSDYIIPMPATPPSEGSARVTRGGCYSNAPEYCTVSYRTRSTPDYRGADRVGFRLVCDSN
jgi:formylglycine-generating enzyme required for sulfatase activity